MPNEQEKKKLGEHKLATITIGVPPERQVIAEIQNKNSYSGWKAVEEAAQMGLLRHRIRHAELSPTFTCPEDCGGCPDRASLHLNDSPEQQIGEAQWLQSIDRLHDLGVEYFMLIGGTIDRQAITPKLMSYILDRGGVADFGWFTDGIMLQNPHTGSLTPLYSRLAKEGRMLEGTTHVSADYLVPEGAVSSGAILNPKIRWENEYGGSRWYKSAYGERLARQLVDAGAKRVILNTAVSTHNINQIFPVYSYVAHLQEYAKETESPTVVLFTTSTWTWRPHLARGDNPRNYDAATLLKEEHYAQLQQIFSFILEDTRSRMDKGLPRIAANSSGFLEGFPEFAITQNVGYEHGSSELAIQPDGTVRIDPIFVSPLMLKHAKNPYGYRDRDIDHNPFEKYNSDKPFPNLIQTTRSNHSWK